MKLKKFFFKICDEILFEYIEDDNYLINTIGNYNYYN